MPSPAPPAVGDRSRSTNTVRWELHERETRRTIKLIFFKRRAADLVMFALVLLHVGAVLPRQQAFDICYWN